MTRDRLGARRILLALILLAAALPARAGEPLAAAPGDRVRLDYREDVRKNVLFLFSYTTSEEHHVAGELVNVTADSVTIRRDGDHAVESRALDGIDRFSVSVGERRHLLGGLAYGLLFGTLLATPITGGENMEGEPMDNRGTAVGVIVGGTVLGGVIGYLVKSDKWKRAEPLQPAFHAQALGDGRGVGIGVACRF